MNTDSRPTTAMPRHQTSSPRPQRTVARRRWRVAALSVALLSITAWTPAAHAAVETEANEAAVQAAFVFNFARFTEWPPSAFGSKTSPLNHCLFGPREALAHALNSLSERPVQGRPLHFIQMERLDELKNCHLVFMAEPDVKRRAQALQALAGQPTLTVSDIEGFAREGGMIGLIRVGTRLRFEINRIQSQKAGLRLAADLLNLATSIVDSDMGVNR